MLTENDKTLVRLSAYIVQLEAAMAAGAQEYAALVAENEELRGQIIDLTDDRADLEREADDLSTRLNQYIVEEATERPALQGVRGTEGRPIDNGMFGN